GAIVLGGEIGTGQLVQVLIDVVGGNGVPLTVVVQVLEQVLAGQFHAALDDVRQAPVSDAEPVLDPAFAAKLEVNLAAFNVHLLAHFGQRLAEGNHPRVFVLVADLAPARMVAILLAPTCIAAGGLQVALAVSADPHVGVGRRDHQRIDALDLVLVADTLAVGVEIGKFAAQDLAAEARLAVIDVVQIFGQIFAVDGVRHERQS
nr:hypothetical protein [Tanacetum cinerariifolium]